MVLTAGQLPGAGLDGVPARFRLDTCPATLRSETNSLARPQVPDVESCSATFWGAHPFGHLPSPSGGLAAIVCP